MKKKYMIHRRKCPTHFDNDGWHYVEQGHEVRVMAEAEGYAMVRCKGCMPYIVPTKELVDKE